MDTLRFFGSCVILTWGRLRRQLWLLAGLVLLCLLLPLGAGRVAEALLSRGVDFAGVTLAVAAPEGDGGAAMAEKYLGGMEDVAQYCRIAAMDYEEALEALEAGEVTAVLCLPEHFVQGVMTGANPDLRLIVSGDRPLESLLLLWVGQSASDILASFQSGVYTVLDLYRESPPPGLSWDQAVFDINYRYIALALDRAQFFRLREVSATQSLPVPLHYSLSLLAYFALACAPLFMPAYGGDWLRFQRRLRGAGRSCAAGYFSGVSAAAGALTALLLPGLLAAGGGHPLALAGAGALMAAFCALFCALCCLAAGSAGRCGTLASLTALLSLALAGGIVPPVLLPASLGRLGWLSPVTWLRQLAAWPLGYEVPASTWACLALCAAGMTALGLALYRRGADRQEAAP